MRIHIEEQTDSVEDEQDLRTLSVVTQLPGPSLRDAMSRRSLGEPDPDGLHVWLEPIALRALVIGDEDWSHRFDGMLQFAENHAFTDPDGRIRAHIEPPPGSRM